MKKIMIFISAVVLVSAAAFLVTIKSQSKKTVSKEIASDAARSAEPQSVAAQSGAQTPGSSASGEMSAQEAYDQVLEEIKNLEHSVGRDTPMEKVMEIFGQVEQKLVDFATQYAGTDEAQDAKYQLGLLNANINNLDKAKLYLEDYIEHTPNAEKTKLGYAHFFLAEAFKNDDKFDQAKKHYSIFIKDYGDVDPRMVSQAKMSLNDIEILKHLAVGKPPIPFEVKGLDGKTISIEKLKGKVVLIDFWATWCGPCRSEMPKVISLYNEFHSKGFEIIGISLDDSRSVLERYLQDNKMTWPQYFEGTKWDNSVAKRYGVHSIPSTFLVDRQGNIRYKAVRGRELARAVEKLVREQ
jgi:thiol-disulfide isomerase/thioredoxin